MSTFPSEPSEVKTLDFATGLISCAKFYGDRPALIEASDGETVTFDAAVDSIARIVGRLDVEEIAEDAVVLSLLPSIGWHFLFFAAVAASGRGFVSLNSEANTEELNAAISTLSPAVAFVPPYLSSHSLKLLEEQNVQLIEIDPHEPLDGMPNIRTRIDLLGRERDGTVYLRTSGTTGEPRFIEHSANALWTAANSFADYHKEVMSHGRFLNVFSYDYLASVFNCGLIPWSAGSAIVSDPQFRRRESALQMCHTVATHSVSVLWLTPRMLNALTASLDAPFSAHVKESLAGVRAVFVGMSAISNAEKRKLETGFGVPVLENYALTETTFITSETLDVRNRGANQSSGSRLPWVELALGDTIDGEQREMMNGNTERLYEIAVKTPFLAAAIRGPDGTRVALQTDDCGFLRTGDVGFLAPTGDLQLVGRLRDIVKRDDGLVQLREVEEHARKFAGVESTAAVLVKNENREDGFVLFVCTTNENDQFAEDLERWLHDSLPRRMWPDHVQVIEQIPLTRSGKIARADLLKRIRVSTTQEDKQTL